MEWFHAVALAALLALAPVTVATPSAAPAPPATASPGALPSAGSGADPGVGPATASAVTEPRSAAAAPVVPQGNTSEYLALPADERVGARFETATIDVSGALAADGGALRGEFDRRWVDVVYDNASTDAERREALRAAAARLERHADELHARERAALESYNAGDLSAGAYLRTLAAIDAEARTLEGATGRLEEYDREFSDPPVSTERIGRIYAKVRSLQGPVRERVGRSLVGEAEPRRVYVESSTNGVVLTTIVGTEGDEAYLREAYLPTARDPAARNPYGEDFTSALEYQENLYPWVWENQDGASFGRGTGPPDMYRVGVYQFVIFHPQGQLTVYFDGGTNTTFLEYQRLELDQIPTGTPEATASDGLRLQVNRTRVGGPLLVRVTDNETGDPVDAAVEIDGERIGATGDDGRLWAVTPQGRFTVNATADGREVSMETSSRRPNQEGS